MRTEVKRKYLFFIILAILTSCSNDDSVDIIRAKGLQAIHGGFNNLFFTSKQDGYLFGYKSGDPKWQTGGKLTRIDTTVVFRTIDGGKTWKESLLGNEIIENISLSDGEIYGETPSKDLNEASIIYKLNKVTNKWDEHLKINGYVRNFKMFNNGLGIIYLNNQNDLFLSKDKGKNWDKLPQLGKVDQIIITKNSVNFIGASIMDEAPYSTLFAEYDIQTNKSNTISFPKDFKAYCIDEYNGEFFFLCLRQDTVELYKLSDGKMNLVHQIYTGTRIFPQKLHVFGKEIAVIIGERESLYVTNHFYDSIDKGKTWEEKELRNPPYSGPMCFFNDNSKQSFLTWMYCGSGELQLIGDVQ